jgi:17beta-estradiol 17-dehydrogenase/3alpha(17beta)-hydroxysteroid dehydrogenase (NAD+)
MPCSTSTSKVGAPPSLVARARLCSRALAGHVRGSGRTGTFFVTQTVSRAIIANQAKDPKLVELGGSIVNIASIIGKMGNIGQGNYSASKGAVISFSKTAARELARNKIRVNAVLPGFINTPMAQAVPDKVKEKMALQIPLGAFGEAEDIADMCTFLASDKSKYVTGAAVEVTGGMGM